jgi:hypothetical protein
MIDSTLEARTTNEARRAEMRALSGKMSPQISQRIETPEAGKWGRIKISEK